MELKRFLDQRVLQYNQPEFVAEDPVLIPHLFTRRQDQEIAGFFAAIFAWGNRTVIIKKSRELLQRMDNAPYDFCLHHQECDLKRLLGFKHRTFNDTDLLYFVAFLNQHYQNYSSLEDAFLIELPEELPFSMKTALINFYHYFFSLPEIPQRTRKHIASPEKNGTCKRLNMYLRWMVRKDKQGVDFGIWNRISMSDLICPIDLHVARVAGRLGLLHRKQMDWRAAEELTRYLLELDPSDPVKYDFALFGLGVVEKYY
ncbi:MAG TPA: TIGR02757 family protein [Arachidicoccus sp.]|nr:TIGR02757 family protein [Arachidicoccus sp.]